MLNCGVILILVIESVKYITEFVLAFFKKESTIPYCAQDVTAIFSCKNESKFITNAICTAIASPKFCKHIIVIDDFSTDSTYNVACNAFTFKDNVKIIKRTSGKPGKFYAQQEGLKYVTTNYIMFIDGDCSIPFDFFIPHSIKNNSAISLKVKPILTSKLNFIERFQIYEYEKAYIAKTAHSIKGVNCCISGAAGIFHTDTLKSILKKHNGIFYGDDLHTTLLLQSHGYKIDHANINIETDVPNTLFKFIRQRALSWNIGGHLNAKLTRQIVYNRKTFVWHKIIFAWEYMSITTDTVKLAFTLYCLFFAPFILLFLYFWYVSLELILYLIQYKRLNQGIYFWILLPFIPLFGWLKLATSGIAWILHWKYKIKK